MSLNCSASHPTITTSYIIVRDTGASWDCSVQTHTQIFDVFGSVGNEVLHNLYCRIKDSRHDELCNSCGIHKKQCRMCNCCCCFIISWMMVAKKKWEQKKFYFLLCKSTYTQASCIIFLYLFSKLKTVLNRDWVFISLCTHILTIAIACRLDEYF